MPFFFIALFVVGFILTAFFGPKAKVENAKAAQLSDFQFPRSEEGGPVPRIYGTVKTKGVNTIGQCKFQAVPIKKKVKTGLFSSKKVITGYKYLTGLDLAVCLGPCVVYRRMWYGNHLIWAGCLYGTCNVERIEIDLPELLGGPDQNGGIGGSVSLYPGSFVQPQDAYLQANLTKPNVDDQVSSYPGIAHMIFEDFYWGNSPNIEAISVEVSYFTNSLELTDSKYVMSNGLDANPIETMYDLCVNDWGNLGIVDPVFNLDSWRAAAYAVWDENNGVSCEIANANQGGDLLKEILRQINGIIVQNPQTGVVDIVLMRKDYVVADLPIIGPSQISALRNFNKKLWEDTFNRLRIKYTNRDNSYNDAVATADDFGNIRFQARVRATDVGMPMCYVPELANALAARELSNLNVPLYQCEIVMDRTRTDLTPGKCFVLTWPEYNIAGIVMRVRRMGLGNRKDGKVTLAVVQDEFSADAVVRATPVVPTTDGSDYGPTDIVAPLFFELPYWLAIAADLPVTADRTNYATFAKKPGAGSIDYFAFIDDNGTDGDTEVLANAPYTATAQLSAAIGLYDGFAEGKLATLNINALTNTAILADGSAALIRSTGQGMFLLNGELWAYETKTDHGDGTYTLNNARRALLDTKIVASAVNDTLYFFDGQEGFWDSDVAVAAFDAYAIDRAATGRSTEAGAAVASLDPVDRQALPLPPDYVTVEGTRDLDQAFAISDTVNLEWRERNRLSGSVALENDADVPAEAATTYTVKVYTVATETLMQTEAGIAATTYALALDAAITGTTRIEVWAIKGGLQSFTPSIIEIYVVDPASGTGYGDDYGFDYGA